MENNELVAEAIEWQTRAGDLQNAVEKLREERDAARASCDLLLHEIFEANSVNKEQAAIIDRLRLHIAQGIEL
jgi:hypothetical protein